MSVTGELFFRPHCTNENRTCRQLTSLCPFIAIPTYQTRSRTMTREPYNYNEDSACANGFHVLAQVLTTWSF
jgi:hypothetical protein